MKNVLIGGVPRSGKSTLAKLLLQHHGLSVLRGDWIMSRLVRTHPEVGISPKPASHEQTVAERTPYLLALFRKLTRYDDIPYVLDSALFSPRFVIEYAKDLSDSCTMVFVGYPEADLATKLAEIKDYAERSDQCLSHEIEVEALTAWVETWIRESREMRQQCLEHGFLFVDTSRDFEASLMSGVNRIAEENPDGHMHADR